MTGQLSMDGRLAYLVGHLADVLWQAGIWLGTTGIAAAIKAHRGFRTVADAMRAGWKLREEIIGESKEGEEE